MNYIFKFPDIGEGITEGKVLKIYVRKGQELKQGDPLIKVETDKVVTDIPCPKTGKIRNLFIQPEQVIQVGEGIVEIALANEGDLQNDQEVVEKKEQKIEEKGFGVVGVIEEAGSSAFLPATGEGFEEEKVVTLITKKALATPVARKMAKDLNVDINQINGTGPGGRVMKADIQKAYDQQNDGSSIFTNQQIPNQMISQPQTEPLSQLRKTIMQKMVTARFTIPHATSYEEVDIFRLAKLKKRLKNSQSYGDKKISYLSFVIKAVALSLKKHPKLNARLDLEKSEIVYHPAVHMGIAVDTPDGLMVPVIRDADQKNVLQISEEINDKAARARTKELKLEELKGSTFSITNYGSIAGIFGVPIINYPEVAILGVGRIQNKLIRSGRKLKEHPFLPLSLSIDHRVIDGGDAGRFLLELMLLLSDPTMMLM
ncbi:MAG: 2-oxo acid dehydrogenase subunit E2 [Spirochaetes bacterium]|nr:2-oxo acid dehydrogenase subunit E2 [Spirochaetota bacterium]